MKQTSEESAVVQFWNTSPYAEAFTIREGTHKNRSYHLENFYSLLRPPSRCVYTEEKQTAESFSLAEETLALFGKICGHDSAFHPLVATVTKGNKDLEVTLKLLENIAKAALSPALKELFTHEVLAKILPYRTCKGGEEFTIFSARYQIDAIFNMGGGVPAYGCIPLGESGSPLLLFRGSEFSLNRRGRSTFKANLDYRGPGYSMYMTARPRLTSWLRKQTEAFGKAKVMGFSLGGALAGYAVLLDPEFFHTGISFNMPGIPKKLVERWQKIPWEERPTFISYVNRGDAVSKIGTLFGEVYEFSFPNPVKLIRAHNLLLLAEPKVFMTEVDLEKENGGDRIFSR